MHASVIIGGWCLLALARRSGDTCLGGSTPYHPGTLDFGVRQGVLTEMRGEREGGEYAAAQRAEDQEARSRVACVTRQGGTIVKASLVVCDKQQQQ